MPSLKLCAGTIVERSLRVYSSTSHKTNHSTAHPYAPMSSAIIANNRNILGCYPRSFLCRLHAHRLIAVTHEHGYVVAYVELERCNLSCLLAYPTDC